MTEPADGAASTGESREETIARVEKEQRELYDATGSSLNRDVSTKRRLGSRGIVRGLVGAVVFAGIGLAIGIFAWNPWIPVSLAVVGFVLAWLVTAEREDGEVARRVESNLESSDHPRGSALDR
jgi:hypothetical protein